MGENTVNIMSFEEWQFKILDLLKRSCIVVVVHYFPDCSCHFVSSNVSLLMASSVLTKLGQVMIDQSPLMMLSAIRDEKIGESSFQSSLCVRLIPRD